MDNLIRDNYSDELFDRELYKELAKMEKNVKVKEVLETLSKGEGTHADFWRQVAQKRGIYLEEKVNRRRLVLFKVLRRILGLVLTLKLAEYGEIDDAEKYKELSQREDFDVEEREQLRKIMNDELSHEELMINSQINEDNVKDAVYAVSDGLIEVLAAVSGLSGIILSPFLVALGGTIVGISGMISMSIGDYLSAKSEEDIKKNAMRKLMLVGKENTKVSTVNQSVKITAVSYILGALVPIIPFAIGLLGLLGLLASYMLTAIVTFSVGFMIGLLSGANPTKKGILMMSLAIGAALLTHGLGLLIRFFGVTVP
ncbi:hypothetical protein HS7_15700 [Sulfolobales archaeon HS-7]|nr:hypothetical protein HS7_15700 [Sulfolobales archaeon HS-7]